MDKKEELRVLQELRHKPGGYESRLEFEYALARSGIRSVLMVRILETCDSKCVAPGPVPGAMGFSAMATLDQFIEESRKSLGKE